jgi:hypothetical protein
MKRPGLIVQCFGFPPVTFAILAICGYVIWQWWGSHLPFFFAIGAFLLGGHAITSYDEVREFEDEERYRRAIETGSEEPEPRETRIRQLVRSALSLGVIYIAWINPPALPELDLRRVGLRYAGTAAALYLLYRCIRLIWALKQRRKKAVEAANTLPAKQEAPFVTCLLPLPDDSPTRDMAERELPDYCAHLLNRRGGLQRL